MQLLECQYYWREINVSFLYFWLVDFVETETVDAKVDDGGDDPEVDEIGEEVAPQYINGTETQRGFAKVAGSAK